MTVTDMEGPSIADCPVTRNFVGCDVSAISGPAYSAMTAPSNYAEFSDANNEGDASDNCGITSVTYVDVANGSCPIMVTRTWTISDGTNPAVSCNQTLQVNAPPVALNCPADVNFTCQTQSAINTAFANWLNSFGFTGGCNAMGSFDGECPGADLRRFGHGNLQGGKRLRSRCNRHPYILCYCGTHEHHHCGSLYLSGQCDNPY
ncbi:MAG: hypothetical protein IPJ00_14620 [Saprospirales bacterium]|nr:hypothetical protein [Saprospirales bacterium]